jgi:hypothetical protein
MMTPFEKKIKKFAINHKINEYMIENLQKIHKLKYNYQQFTNPITIHTVNSGMTDGEHIIIWRIEEFNKVMIHELIHFYGLEKNNDYRLSHAVHVSNNFKGSPRETFTELQTWYLYTIYRLRSGTSIVGINQQLNTERLHSILNMIKILRHFKISSIKQLLSDSGNLINTDTSVVYYYIFKAILLYKFDQWVIDTITPLTNNKRDPHIANIIDEFNLKHPEGELDDRLTMMYYNN